MELIRRCYSTLFHLKNARIVVGAGTTLQGVFWTGVRLEANLVYRLGGDFFSMRFDGGVSDSEM